MVTLTHLQLTDYYNVLALTHLQLTDYYNVLALTHLQLTDYYNVLALTHLQLTERSLESCRGCCPRAEFSAWHTSMAPSSSGFGVN